MRRRALRWGDNLVDEELDLILRRAYNATGYALARVIDVDRALAQLAAEAEEPTLG